ncbi:MAG: YqgE/AlgH family protein [Brachymonas sp.]|nr:YqgE/AlgH family protein [Brachymonas sp.]
MPTDTPLAVDLSQHLLIAMPGMDDMSFARSVIYICEHTSRGALGLCLNKPLPMSLLDLLSQRGLPLKRDDLRELPLCWGGPVQTERGFMLHPKRTGAEEAEAGSDAIQDDAPPTSQDDDAWPYASSLSTADGLQITTSKDILEALSYVGGPTQIFAALGYCAWEKGQLEQELGQNSWLTVPAEHSLIFDMPLELRYEGAMRLLGVSEASLSAQAGHA